MGLIQYGLEKAGISTISISHLVNLTKKVRVPRALYLRYPLGRSYGRAFEKEFQRKVLLDLIHYLPEMNIAETIIKLPYKWQGKFI